MYEGKKILATVCARSGSKGVKNKNIRLMNEKPMICYTLDLLRGNTIIDNYVISTDSENIIEIVKNYGFDVHFKRPNELAGDKISRVDVIKHAVSWMEENTDKQYDIILDLGVATPLKIYEDIKGAIEKFIDSNVDYLTTVTPSQRNPYYNMVEKTDGKIMIVKKLNKKITDRREAPAVYDLNDGAHIWFKKTLFSNNDYKNNMDVYVMPKKRSVDVDEEIDFILAKTLIENFKIKE